MFQGYKTFLGIFLAAAPTLANLLGYDIGSTFSDEFPKAVEDVVTIVGLCVALYGRLVAQSPGWLAKRDF
ncbi:MAG: hypothetical protein [Siphoviridae sp. ctpQM7]|nr:MAG: hypothetical protein [Siphoviridae sp. ctpQM7]